MSDKSSLQAASRWLPAILIFEVKFGILEIKLKKWEWKSWKKIQKPMKRARIVWKTLIKIRRFWWKRKKNVELWNLYDKVFAKASQFCPDIKFCWVKGHTSNSDFFSEMNNLADKLAVEASQEYETKKEQKQETH